jgi:hypothetical protein
MKPLLARSARSSRRAGPPVPESPAFSWIHDGTRYRASVWPDVRFERETEPGVWREAELGEDVFASAALGVGTAAWRRYLEYVPAGVRDFLEQFTFGRLAALHLVVRCPDLLPELRQVPALTPFLVRHQSLRGGEAPAWPEINAIYEREGLFGVLQWLGLPASRQTVAILEHVAEPDLACRLLEPLRASLWEPETIWALSHLPNLTDERLAATCHAMAA